MNDDDDIATPRARLLLLALTAFLMLARLASYNEPLEWDIGTYVTIAREILAGERLYADAWDVKPPAIFATYAAVQAIAGDRFFAVFVLSVIAAIVTMLGLYRAAAWVAGRAAGLWAAAFWAAMCFDPGVGGNLPNTEVFINAAIAWALALWLRENGGRGWHGRWLTIGALFGVASMYKQVAVAPAIALGIAELAIQRRAALPRVAIAAATGAALWCVVFAYFAATGRGWLLWQTVVQAPRAYGGDQLQNLIDSFRLGKGISPAMAFVLPALVLTLIGAAMGTKAAPRRAWVLLAALALGTHVAVALPGPFHAHYQQLWFVPLSIGAGWGAAALTKLSRLGEPRLATAAAGLALLAIAFPQLTWFPLSGRERAQRKYGDFFTYANDAVRDAGRLLLPDETFYAWSDEGWAYALIGKRPPATGLWKSHMIKGPLAEWLTQRTLEQLRRDPPELFIHFGQPPGPPGHPIVEWSLANYAPLPGENNAHFPMYFYVLRGGVLERRLANPATSPRVD